MFKKIAHITDLHLYESYPFDNCETVKKRFDIILQDIENNGISEIVCTGDIGDLKGVGFFFEKLREKSLKITLGNHDSFAVITEFYKAEGYIKDKKLYSSSIENNYQFIYLDSSEGIIDKKQLFWLKNKLDTSKSTLIFLHHPIIKIDLKVDEIGKLTNRKEVLNLLVDSSNKITVYCGHYHMESTLIHKNITQHITPSVSFQIRKHKSNIEIDTSSFGYRIIQIEKDDLTSEIQLFSNAK